ncbi:activin receptor type-2A-like [Anopheles ziemanni]|uniref:activin receptor type-2A-like n=1 Tax=Anopheles coustani TaxID=139045 RepID=UPI002659197C|nr:activin receptor type-2A-like [Anopheles coustani]XP_058176428.1 activin receptor type-2A-like [Anopheles ziemanni]
MCGLVHFLFYLSLLMVIKGSLSRARLADELRCVTYACKDGECMEGEEVCDETEPERGGGCFVVWMTNNVTNEINVTMKGCFTHPTDCNHTECVDTSTDMRKNLNFCCCRGNLCNKEQKWVPISTKAPELAESVAAEANWPIILVISLTSFVIALILLWAYYFTHQKQAMFNEIPTVEPDISSSSTNISNRPIDLKDIKARGRFGVVWRAQLGNQEVAVKIFPMQERQSWITEQDIFKLPRMNHPNILEFIGCEKRVDMASTDFWLITAYCENGSLCDFLKAHTVSWTDLCKIASTMARGLTHLHEEVQGTRTDGLKPSIAHRDFKSKNVLLKADLTACIADFGLALVFTPGKSCGDTHGQVGTRRYMAPEVLEGAINFTRDAFLRIDVYACGLVLWELVSRCTVHGGPVDEYRLPFETELGPHPTLEEMQENVVTKKLRPRIFDPWRNHAGLNAICETMEDCWDHDAEARLSSSCVLERLSQYARFPTRQFFVATNTTNELPTKIASESV